jgi:heme-degrading monooxygenase HmoA
MILEHAAIDIHPGRQAEFEHALGQARPVIAAARGFLSLSLHRSMETPHRYVLLVGWESVEDHMVGFRQSSAFAQWRALIGPYFAAPPVVGHLVPVEGLT